jgi:hypothetical protein
MMQHHVTMRLDGTTTVPVEWQYREFVYRAICHALLDGLELPALQEVAESIVDAYRAQNLPVAKRSFVSVVTPPRIHGKLGAPKRRPSFHLGDE